MKARQKSHLERHAKCTSSGKLRYKTMQSAERAMARIVVHGSGLQVPCRSYLCDACGGWHLTSAPRHRSYGV